MNGVSGNKEQTIKQYKVQRLEHSKKVPMNGQKNESPQKTPGYPRDNQAYIGISMDVKSTQLMSYSSCN